MEYFCWSKSFTLQDQESNKKKVAAHQLSPEFQQLQPQEPSTEEIENWNFIVHEG